MTTRTTPLAKCLPKDVPPPWAEVVRKVILGAAAAKSKGADQLNTEVLNDGFDAISCIAAETMTLLRRDAAQAIAAVAQVRFVRLAAIQSLLNAAGRMNGSFTEAAPQRR